MLAGLMVLISNCGKGKPKLELVKAETLTSFPSASAIEISGNRLYILGDDAPYLLILDTGFRILDTVHYTQDTASRIPKPVKPDIEAAVIQGGTLIALGSFSDRYRKVVLHFPLADARKYRKEEYFEDRFFLRDIQQVNFEGLAVVEDYFLVAQRANLSERKNRLLIAQADPVRGLLPGRITDMPSLILELPDAAVVKGISGLFYYAEKDILFFTASTEETASATEDGAIGESYLGWIKEFTKRKSMTLKPDQFISLSKIASVFNGHKVESVSVQKGKGQELILFLVSDNDNGQSGLFKLTVDL